MTYKMFGSECLPLEEKPETPHERNMRLLWDELQRMEKLLHNAANAYSEYKMGETWVQLGKMDLLVQKARRRCMTINEANYGKNDSSSIL